MPFPPGTHVIVKQVSATDWELREPIAYAGDAETFVAEPPMRTDFASVPRLFVWLIPRYGTYTKAAIIHDLLWKRAADDGFDWADADGVFRRAMGELGVPFLNRWFMWAAVRIAALRRARGRRDWLRRSWRVLPLLVLALPIVALPAIAIVVGLAVYYALELVFWVPLEISARMKGERHPADKPVNLPRVELST